MSENTVIKSEYIRKVRPVAVNVTDTVRIDPYIREVETLDVMPAIGVGLYAQLTDDSFAESLEKDGCVILTADSGKEITVSREQWDAILDGGFYTCENCPCGSDKKRYSGGLGAAISYLAYARMLPNQPINVTAFGVVNKTTALSEPVEDRMLFRAANEARKTGLEYLRQSVEHLRCAGIIDGYGSKGKRYRKFIAIG